jgi:phage anti-repressor protein
MSDINHQDNTLNQLSEISQVIVLNKKNISFPIDSRQLYTWLGIKSEHSHWIKRLIEKYDFEENQDFILCVEKDVQPSGTKTKHVYNLSLDCAKEIAMVSNTPKGKEARKYFIECEKLVRNSSQLERLTNETQAQYELRIAENFVSAKKLQVEAEHKATIARSEADEALGKLNETIQVKEKLENKIDHHIQMPKAPPEPNNSSMAYTNSEIATYAKSIRISEEAIVKLLQYVGHPTIIYKQLVKLGQNKDRPYEHPIINFSKKIDIGSSINKALFPSDQEKIKEYENTSVRFSERSISIINHPANQNKSFRLKKGFCINEKILPASYFSSQDQGGFLGKTLPYLEVFKLNTNYN